MIKINLLFKENTNLRVSNSRILTIKNAKLSGYHFYMNLNICGDFQICISVPLNLKSISRIFVRKHVINYMPSVE